MQIGIFWIFEDCIYTYTQKALYDNQDVDMGHVDYWQELCLKHKELREYSYDYIPRGRVLLKGAIPVVYSSKEIINSLDKRELIQKSFELSSNTKFIYDEHYSPILDLGFEKL